MNFQRLLSLVICLSIIIALQPINSVKADGKVGPKIVSSVPENNATVAIGDHVISLNFDESIKEGRFYKLITLVVDRLNTQQSVPISVSIQGSRLEVAPLQSLEEGRYTLFLPMDAVQSLNGNWLENEYDLSFNVSSSEANFPNKMTSASSAVQSVSSFDTMTANVASTSNVVVREVFAGGAHSGIISSTGSVWSWGSNSYGQLGDGTSTSTFNPVLTLGTNLPTVAVSGGASRSVALKSDKSVWTWGYNPLGILGIGSSNVISVNNPTPVQTSFGPLTDVAAVESGDFHSVALLTDGSVMAWGFNTEGQLGAGSLEFAKHIAVSVEDEFGFELGGVTAISAGGAHTVAIQYGGRLLGWGSNNKGQLGEYVSGQSLVAIPIVDEYGWDIMDAKGVSAGYDFTIILKEDGTVWGLGSNAFGQLGNGTLIDSSIPVQVKGPGGTGVLSNIIAISSGAKHVLALRSDGTVWTWGNNSYGQLGDGTLVSRSTPVQVQGVNGSGFLQQVQSISAGDYHNVILTNDKKVLTWGSNSSGQLGIENSVFSNFPVQTVWGQTPSNNITYIYDQAGRLETIRYSLQDQVFEIRMNYDANGNLLSKSIVEVGS
ncbi:RCC1 domain-containing protein [Cohnella fermenti]|uniref:Uncharacterized protein n=1 Tax=Cohnella fermenti TaxID=2565925 RepID=A0A4V3WG60_9BACL|nr:Ig-like domain-containing protein [Cohnella fermenti]THF82731.1 hypothetical protein E6C55_06625 [Cohnella fermenti]